MSYCLSYIWFSHSLYVFLPTDPLFISVLGEVFGSLVASKTQVGYEIVMRQAVPVLCNAILASTNDTAWTAEAALDLLDSVIGARGDADLGEGFFATIAPALFHALATTEDRDVIQVRRSMFSNNFCAHETLFRTAFQFSHSSLGSYSTKFMLGQILQPAKAALNTFSQLSPNNSRARTSLVVCSLATLSFIFSELLVMLSCLYFLSCFKQWPEEWSLRRRLLSSKVLSFLLPSSFTTAKGIPSSAS